MIEPPRKPYMVRVAEPPLWFHLPHNIDRHRVRLLEPVHEGVRIPVVGQNDFSKKLNFNFDALEE
jgi:hypothetical protein